MHLPKNCILRNAEEIEQINGADAHFKRYINKGQTSYEYK